MMNFNLDDGVYKFFRKGGNRLQEDYMVLQYRNPAGTASQFTSAHYRSL
jgi:hypothetical protein